MTRLRQRPAITPDNRVRLPAPAPTAPAARASDARSVDAAAVTLAGAEASVVSPTNAVVTVASWSVHATAAPRATSVCPRGGSPVPVAVGAAVTGLISASLIPGFALAVNGR